jgi:hypothetical protein
MPGMPGGPPERPEDGNAPRAPGDAVPQQMPDGTIKDPSEYDPPYQPPAGVSPMELQPVAAKLEVLCTEDGKVLPRDAYMRRLAVRHARDRQVMTGALKARRSVNFEELLPSDEDICSNPVCGHKREIHDDGYYRCRGELGQCFCENFEEPQ